MRSPARLVTGTAAAALTAAALGLVTAPTVYADELGRPGRTAATAAPDASECLTDSAAEDAGALCEEEDTAGSASLSSPWSGTAEEGEGDEELDALTGAKPGTGTWPEPGTDPGTGNRPEPGTDPGTGKPTSKPPATRPAPTPTERPSGHVRTGVGGSAAPDTAQLAVGGGLLGVAAVGGVWLARRGRALGTRDA
ncbi:MAG TPA: hypothetical protein DD420_28425 [Streptomyces sp.]|nr:hypothetical protein [Streptomyces sp.]